MSGSDEPTLEIDPEQLRFDQCNAELLKADDSQREEILLRYYPDNAKHRALADLMGHPLAAVWNSGSDDFELGVEQPKHKLLPQDPRVFGRYDVLGRLGHGGMGVVYRAFDRELQREVALKLISPMQLHSRTARTRFMNEARAVAALEHEAIVSILDTGEVENAPYISLPIIDGEDFGKMVFKHPDSAKSKDAILSRARIIERIARGVAHAHSRGFMHRDIKPANIIVRHSDSRALLMDFGLAIHVDGDDRLTQTGSVVGTPSFAAPEQLAGASNIDHRADVYSLGATLYASLTGAVPFGDSSKSNILKHVQETQLPPIRSINPLVSQDLQTVCEIALEKHPDDRFGSAELFADELNRAIAGLPLKSKPVSGIGRLQRWAKRNRTLAASLVVLLAIMLASSVMYVTRPAYLTLRIEPATASVMLDEEPLSTIAGRGTQPLDPGERRLRVVADGYLPYEEMITLRRGSAATTVREVRLVPRLGRLEISTNPSDANVVLKDASGEIVAQGKTPFRTGELASGELMLHVAKPLFSDVVRSVQVPNDRQTLTVESIRLETAFPPEYGSPRLAQRILDLNNRFANPVQAKDQPLSEIIENIERECNASIEVDWGALQKIGYKREMRLSMTAHSMSAFNTELRNLGLTLILPRASQEHWIVSSVEASESTLLTGLYSLKPLRLRINAAQAKQLIYVNIQPGSWEFLGGASVISTIPDHEALSISTTLEIHMQLSRYLKSLSELSIRDASTGSLGSENGNDEFEAGKPTVVDKTWGLSIQSEPRHLLGHTATGHGLLFLDDHRLVSASEDASLRLWDTSTGSELKRFQTGDRRILCLARVPGGDRTNEQTESNESASSGEPGDPDDETTEPPVRFVSGDGIGNVCLFDANQDAPLVVAKRHHGDVTSLAVDPSGEWLMSGGSDGFYCRFKLPELEYQRYGRTGCHNLGLIAFDSQRLALAAVGEESIWALDAESLATSFSVKTSDVIPQLLMVTIPHSRWNKTRLVIAGTRLSSWSLGKGGFTIVSLGEEPQSPVQSIAKFNHRSLFVALHHDGRAVFRDSDTLKEVASIKLPYHQSRSGVAISPDDSKLAAFNWIKKDNAFQPAIYIYDLQWKAP